MILAKHAQKKQTQTYKHNKNFKIKYPGLEGYHFPEGRTYNSPCMDSYWRAQPIRQGKKREEEIEHEEKQEDEEEDLKKTARYGFTGSISGQLSI